jgi:hypothetical protein
LLPNPKDNRNKLPDVTRKRLPAIDIPKNMTPDHYYGMNLLPGHRIGLGVKERYIAILSDLYVEGYLTEEEYDKRTDWVNAAQTSEQIEIAFMDLQQSLLQIKIKDYLKDIKPVKKTDKSVFIPAGIFYIIVIFMMVIDALNHTYWGVGILGAELLIATGLFAYQTGKRHGR